MEITDPYAEILYISPMDGVALMRCIEHIARVSHRSEEKQTDTSWQRFISSVVIDKGDWSVTEHGSVTVVAVVDRGVTHEWVRHRLGAYTQESTRFVNYTKNTEPQFIVPLGFMQGSKEYAYWSQAVDTALFAYRDLVLQGVSPQLARSVLPNSLASKLIITYDLRMWRHFFLSRTTKETHPQMKQVTVPLLAEFKEKIPLLYDDIVAEERQIINMQKAH